MLPDPSSISITATPPTLALPFTRTVALSPWYTTIAGAVQEPLMMGDSPVTWITPVNSGDVWGACDGTAEVAERDAADALLATVAATEELEASAAVTANVLVTAEVADVSADTTRVLTSNELVEDRAVTAVREVDAKLEAVEAEAEVLAATELDAVAVVRSVSDEANVASVLADDAVAAALVLDDSALVEALRLAVAVRLVLVASSAAVL